MTISERLIIIFIMIILSLSIIITNNRIGNIEKQVSYHDSILTYENIGKFEDIQKRLDRLDKLHEGLE